MCTAIWTFVRLCVNLLVEVLSQAYTPAIQILVKIRAALKHARKICAAGCVPVGYVSVESSNVLQLISLKIVENCQFSDRDCALQKMRHTNLKHPMKRSNFGYVPRCQRRLVVGSAFEPENT